MTSVNAEPISTLRILNWSGGWRSGPTMQTNRHEEAVGKLAVLQRALLALLHVAHEQRQPGDRHAEALRSRRSGDVELFMGAVGGCARWLPVTVGSWVLVESCEGS